MSANAKPKKTNVEAKAKYDPYKEYLSKSKDFYQKAVLKASTNLILTFAVISVFAFFAIKPTLVTITKLNKELEESKMVNRKLEKKIKDLEQARIFYSQAEPDLPLVDLALPQKVNFNQFASKINYLAFSHNLTLLSNSFEEFDFFSLAPPETKEIEKAEASSFNFKITVVGSFTDIKNFVQDLEKIDRVVQINTVTFSNSKALQKKQLQAEINAKAFWLTSPETVEE